MSNPTNDDYRHAIYSEQPVAVCPTCGGMKEKPQLLPLRVNREQYADGSLCLACGGDVLDDSSAAACDCWTAAKRCTFFHSSTEQGSQHEASHNERHPCPKCNRAMSRLKGGKWECLFCASEPTAQAVAGEPSTKFQMAKQLVEERANETVADLRRQLADEKGQAEHWAAACQEQQLRAEYAERQLAEKDTQIAALQTVVGKIREILK